MKFLFIEPIKNNPKLINAVNIFLNFEFLQHGKTILNLFKKNYSYHQPVKEHVLIVIYHMFINTFLIRSRKKFGVYF